MSEPAGWSPLYGLSQRLPPTNLQAEQALLGALMANNRALERVADFLRVEHFADPVHARIYRAIEERILDGRLADAVTLKGDLENIGILDEVGGVAYLTQLLTAMVGILHVGDYAKSIYDSWLRRQLIDVGANMVNTAFSESRLDGTAQIAAAERALADIRFDGQRRDRLMTIGEAVTAAIRAAEAAFKQGISPALLTGLAPFDAGTGGFWPGDFSLLGGVPGAGKTALAVQLATMIGERLRSKAMEQGATAEDAEQQPGVVVFSLEMSAEELGARVASARSDISVQRLRAGDLDMRLAESLLFVERGIAGLPVRIFDCRETSRKLLGPKIRMHLRRQPELLVVVDHLLQPSEEEPLRGRTADTAASVAKLAREMKSMARDTGVPFLVLTHVPRAAGRRDNPRPSQSDVKWAGEGDADNVLFVHRPIMFMDNERPKKWPRELEEKYSARVLQWQIELDRAEHLSELVVAKRRMGATGVHRLWWDGPTTSFSDWDSRA
jgi:replicative DNA helicase